MNLPVVTKAAVWHIGSMRRSDKKGGSLEGGGLSVSEHPQAWRRIARLGGYPWWLLEKRGGAFLDFHKASKGECRKEIIAWAVATGYVTNGVAWRSCRYDDEFEQTLCSDHTTREEAEEEEGDEVSRIKTLIPTAQLLKRMGGGRGPLSLGMDFAATAYAEDVLRLDGVWWRDRLDPERLSAPRGVIFASMLGSWRATQRAPG